MVDKAAPAQEAGAKPHPQRATKAQLRPDAQRHQLSERFADPDLVDRIFDYIRETFPQLDAACTETMKRAAREEFKGAVFYIPTRSPSERQLLVAEALRLFNGRNATEVARRLRISRATVYRWLKQPGHR